MPAIKRVERKREGSRMEMRTFTRIRSHCMNCTVTYNTPLMYTNSVYFYIVCKIKNKTFDAGPAIFFFSRENIILFSRNTLSNYTTIYNTVDNICKL